MRTREEIFAVAPTILPAEPRCGFEGPPGWYDVMYEFCLRAEALARLNPNPPTIDQWKEKFSSGRIYFSHHDEWISALAGYAENKMGETCQTCGAPGTGRGGSWLRTLCDGCHEKCERR